MHYSDMISIKAIKSKNLGRTFLILPNSFQSFYTYMHEHWALDTLNKVIIISQPKQILNFKEPSKKYT